MIKKLLRRVGSAFSEGLGFWVGLFSPNLGLLRAVQGGLVAEAQSYLRRGADANGTYQDGSPILIEAALDQNVSLVQVLLRAGADPNCRDDKGHTPLIAAARKGNGPIVHLLMVHGGQPTLQDQDGLDAIGHLLHWRKLEVLRAFEPFSIALTANQELFKAIVRSDPQQVEALLSDGVGADVSLGTRTATALHFASYLNRTEIVRLLLGVGASIDARTDDGKTPLMFAAKRGRASVVEILLEAGANRFLVEKNGKTALELAKLEGHSDVVQLLSEPAERIHD